MKVALVYPPFADATQPYSSLPALASYIRSRGNHEVTLHDANLESVLHFLSRECLESARLRIADRIREFESGGKPVGGGARQYALALAASLKAPIVAERIGSAIDAFRSAKTFQDLGALNSAKRLYEDALDVLSAAWYPVGLRASDLADPAASNIGAIDSLACDRLRNPFLAFLEAITVPELVRSGCQAVGISITYQTQILPAATLSRLIRRHLPGVAVVFGGQMASCWYEGIAGCPEVLSWCDYIIGFEGETALDRLLSALESGCQPTGTPNLAWRREGRVQKNVASVEDINALPTPDYAGLPLQRYLAPEPVLMLNASRGCYWSKCEFCAVSPAMRNGCRIRRDDLVIGDICTLQQRHAARCFTFGDDCVPPRTLRALASGLISRGVKCSWQCEVRFEKALTADLLGELRAAGCRNLIFGLESFSARVLRLMNKGVQLSDVTRILQDCRRHQIAFNLQLFFGFPGETPQEARKTLAFVTRQLHGAATVSFGEFQLLRGSGVARRPEAFGIRPAANSAPMDIRLDYEPVPEHAAVLKNELRDRLLNRARFKSLPLRIDALTLLYLDRAGVRAMAKSYYLPRAKAIRSSAAGSSGGLSSYVRGPWQSVGQFRDWEEPCGRRILLYEYEADRSVELSKLALWIVMRGLDRPKTVADLAGELASATGEPFDPILATTTEVVAALSNRGILREVGGR